MRSVLKVITVASAVYFAFGVFHEGFGPNGPSKIQLLSLTLTYIGAGILSFQFGLTILRETRLRGWQLPPPGYIFKYQRPRGIGYAAIFFAVGLLAGAAATIVSLFK